MKRTVAALLLFCVSQAPASPAGDDNYGFKRFVVATTNLEAEPVYGEQVERALSDALRRNPRFDVSAAGYLRFKEKLKTLQLESLGNPGTESLLPMAPAIEALAALKVQAMVLAEVRPDADSGKYQIFLVLATVSPRRTITSELVSVPAVEPLENFRAAAEQGLDEILRSIPFDATLVSRHGDTVVLDRGAGTMEAGLHLPTFTIETRGQEVGFLQTGEIVVTRVEPDLSFGKVLSETTPGSLTEDNKVRVQHTTLLSLPAVADSGGSRGIASIEATSFEREDRSLGGNRLGFVEADLGAQMLSVDNRVSPTQPASEGSYVYPRLSLAAELWITARIFFDLGLDFSMSPLSGTAGGAAGTSSSVHQFRAQVGYRIHFYAPEPGPYVHFKLGLASENYDSNAPATIGFTELHYGGLLLGAGVGLPIRDRYGVGLDVNTLLFPSASTPSGGDSHDVSGWDLTLDGYYKLSPTLRLDGKLILLGNGAEFTQGPLRYAHQSGRALWGAVSYYF